MPRYDERVLSAVADALLPPTATAGPGAYPAATEVGVDVAARALVARLPQELREQMERLLTIFQSPWLNLFLTGHAVRFLDLDVAAREAYLRSWALSRLSAKRRGFQAVKRLMTGLYYSAPTDADTHPLWEKIGYALPAPGGSEEAPGTLRLGPPQCPTDGAMFDVVIVGSGAGGSVIASRVARAGWTVAVLEAGEMIAPARYPRIEREAHERMFAGQGALTTADAVIGLLAGATPGGGTAVNWMTCLPPRIEAREEWRAAADWTDITGEGFDRPFAEVSTRMHVGIEESDVNPSNDALRRGCLALGYREGPDWAIIPRNASSCRGRCGFCTFGCPYGGRQGGLETFLRDALEAGAHLYSSTTVERVVLQGGRAHGVEVTYHGGSRPTSVRLRARAVVLAAGALSTPALLLRSDVRFPGIGVGLRLDPTTAIAGEFPHSIRPWEGPPQTVGVYRFQTTDDGAHGPWIEVAPAHPGLAAIALPWTRALAHRERLERLGRAATPIVLVRDVGEGRVRLGRDEGAMFDYVLDRRDRRNLTRGLVEAARILRAAGATRIYTLHTPPIEAGDGSRGVPENDLDRFLAEVERRGIREGAVALFSAHPLGAARAGLDSHRSAARPPGEVHGVDGLWIGDGSLLPSAPGSNPMMSIMTLAWRTADHLLVRLGADLAS